MAEFDGEVAERLARLRRIQDEYDDAARLERAALREREARERHEDEEWQRRHEERLRVLAATAARAERDLAAANAEAERLGKRIEGRLRARAPGGDGALVAMLVALIFVFIELAMTIGHLTGHDIADAHRFGHATVQYCHRTGPVGDGFGFWDRCVAKVVWDDGGEEPTSLTVGGSFFDRDEVGKTVVVGDAGTHRGARQLARKERPYRLYVQVLAGACAMVASVFGLFLVGVISGMFKQRAAVRRRVPRPS